MNGLRQEAEWIAANTQSSPLKPQECYHLSSPEGSCLFRLTQGQTYLGWIQPVFSRSWAHTFWPSQGQGSLEIMSEVGDSGRGGFLAHFTFTEEPEKVTSLTSISVWAVGNQYLSYLGSCDCSSELEDLDAFILNQWVTLGTNTFWALLEFSPLILTIVWCSFYCFPHLPIHRG